MEGGASLDSFRTNDAILDVTLSVESSFKIQADFELLNLLIDL